VKRVNDIGQNIVKIRVHRGLTQDQTVARIQCLGKEGLKFTIQMLKNIETGRTGVNHWQLRCLCEALHCTPNDIFFGLGRSTPNATSQRHAA